MLLGAFDHFHGIAEHLFGPFDQRAGVTAVNKYLGDGVESAEQPRQHCPRSHTVLDAGRMHHNGQQVALRIDAAIFDSPPYSIT